MKRRRTCRTTFGAGCSVLLEPCQISFRDELRLPVPPAEARIPREGPSKVNASPGEATLGAIFDAATSSDSRRAEKAQLEHAVKLLRQRFTLELEPDDDVRLLALLGQTGAPTQGHISREQFVARAQQFLRALEHLAEAGLTMQQLKAVLTSVFERFDRNGDGAVCLNEFRDGMVQLGIEVGLEDSACLYRFLTPVDALNRESLKPDLPAEERLASITNGASAMLQERFQWASVVNLVKGLEALIEANHSNPWSCLSHIASEICERVEDLGNVADGLADLTGLAVALQCLATALGDGVGQPLDPTKIAPIALFTGAFLAKVNKDLRELVPQGMSEDRALLYWGLFHKYGFSQASFCTLLACGHWSVTEPGEVLSNQEDSTLRILVKGSAAVQRLADDKGGGTGLQLPPFATIGETSFLRGGGRLWEREIVVALEPVVTVSWDFENLQEVLSLDLEAATCFDGLLSRSMISNFQLAAQSRRHMGAADIVDDLSSYTSVHDLNDAFAAMDSDGDGQISKEELAQCMESLPYVLQKAGFVSSRADLDHLFGFLDPRKEGCVTLAGFKERLRDMEGAIAHLQAHGMTLEDVSAILQRSHAHVDTDGDGCISPDELRTLMHKLHVGMDEQQCAALLAYFDSKGSGTVNLVEWQEHHAFVLSALKNTVHWQAEKKGLRRLSHLTRKLMNVAQRAEEDPLKKLRNIFEVACHSAEDLCNAGNVALDASGGVASLASLLHFSSGSAEDSFGASLLLLSLSVFPVMRRHWADRHVTDLREHEAHLYRKTFEKAGLSITDFRKLLKHGSPRWQRLPAGTTVHFNECALQTVVSGCCSVHDEGLGLLTAVRSGRFLCSPDLSSQVASGAGHVAYAVEPTSVVTWDWESLRRYLLHQPRLRVKLQRAIAISRAECLLETSPVSRT